MLSKKTYRVLLKEMAYEVQAERFCFILSGRLTNLKGFSGNEKQEYVSILLLFPERKDN